MNYGELNQWFLREQQWALLLILAAPLAGALFSYCTISLGPRRQMLAGWIAVCAAFVSFAVSVCFWLFLDWSAEGGAANSGVFLFPWIAAGGLHLDAALKLDSLSLTMILTVTGVGTLIHLYAIGYMAHDHSKPRFFSYFNLFLFFMLLLVLADNLGLMFVGWEGVGLCSYLLIGFWHQQMPNARAGQKAFVVNRIGDAGFLLGMFLLAAEVGSLDFDAVQDQIAYLNPWAIEAACMLLLLGAVGKSAQIPLFVWLPDAMAGPTPVSALIHAATMVTAGVYMIVRLSPLYNAAPAVQFIILALGSLTALLAASIALVQYDIKKVLAYSTVSQLGYMFMALGAGAYSYAMFHLVTHAFFKGLLFMAAGAVITGCRHEQDMRRFGGLWSPMWGTFIAYLAGTYAIAGLPLGSGAYSKEAILWAVYTAPDTAAGLTLFNLVSWGGLFWGIGLAVAFLTACYMTRSLVLTFFGSYRGEGEASESSATMLVAMAVLIPPAMFFGHSRGIPLLESLRPWARQDLLLSQSELMRDDLYRALEHIALFAAGAGVVLMLLAYSIGRGFMMRLGNCIPERINPLCCKWWVDELYEYLIVRPLAFTARVLFFAVDRKLIDRSIDLSAEIAGASGQMLGLLHTGRIGHYLLIMLAGLFFGAAFWLVF